MFYHKILDSAEANRDRCKAFLDRAIESMEIAEKTQDFEGMMFKDHPRKYSYEELKGMKKSAQTMYLLFNGVMGSHCFQISLDQARVFAKIKANPISHMPFPEMFIDISGEIKINDIKINGIVTTTDESGKCGIISLDKIMVGSNGGSHQFLTIKADTYEEIAYTKKTEEQEILFNIAANFIEYVNSQNIEMQEVVPQLSKKRKKQHRNPKKPYYTLKITGKYANTKAQSTGHGSSHSFCYDVRGHFRRRKNKKSIWIPPHKRGVGNALYIPKVYSTKNS